MSEEKLCVIGGDAAAMSAAGRARRRRPELSIEVFETGDYVSYGACGIPYYISGSVKQLMDLVVVSKEEFEQKRDIKVNLGHRAEKISPDKNAITVRDLASGEEKEVSYDHLLIATGAKPIVPPGIDLELPGVFALRGLMEAGKLKEHIVVNSPKKALIIGGGYIGVEMAEALKMAGMDVSMVEFAPRLMPVMEEEVSEAVSDSLSRHGVEYMTGAGAEKVEEKKKGLRVTLSNSDTIDTDMVLLAIGVTPRSELAQDAGLDLGVRKAIKVDRKQKTSHDNIWAAGDCAEAYHLVYGKNAYIPLALTANRQGRVAGSNIGGEDAEFPGIAGTAVTRVFDLAVARTGLGVKEAGDLGLDAEKIEIKSNSQAHYCPDNQRIHTLVIVERGSGKLLGAQMFGKEGVAQRINLWAMALTQGMDLEEISQLDLAYAPPFSPVFDPVLQAAEVALKKTR
ncbi:MAG: FAD-dependent oxidoreductase [bacterium]